MSQYSLLPVIISFVIIYHPVETFPVFSCEESEAAPFAPDGDLHDWARVFFFYVMPDFRLCNSPNANTTLRPMLQDSPGLGLRLDLGLEGHDVCKGDYLVTRIGIAQYCNLFFSFFFFLTRKTLFTHYLVF